jgi:hypothetical protein
MATYLIEYYEEQITVVRVRAKVYEAGSVEEAVKAVEGDIPLVYDIVSSDASDDMESRYIETISATPIEEEE